ncbi:hypothetical protein FEM48_Zijuj06G0183600 [Ziziphus jujuba var. spinosa]|uniref:Uncharacterized protein n=1 Tax=Ziziphus jujuba var. spinosa TaxID=714518 RepID=A0A978VAW2_ZIZJJ|nr:hypothetical protein FEM48_Zijuj06G0183600 [Ziziphus jujuba var. spinosa]
MERTHKVGCTRQNNILSSKKFPLTNRDDIRLDVKINIPNLTEAIVVTCLIEERDEVETTEGDLEVTTTEGVNRTTPEISFRSIEQHPKSHSMQSREQTIRK